MNGLEIDVMRIIAAEVLGAEIPSPVEAPDDRRISRAIGRREPLPPRRSGT
jgi:hypothetical protein